MPTPIFQTTLESSYELCKGTKHFLFRLKDPLPFAFKAGQFVMVHAMNGPKLERRPYSIASPPSLKGAIELCLNRVEGGFMSNYLCDLKGDEAVPMDGPYGKFLVREPIERGVLFVATGTGIAPFRSQIHDLLESGKAEGKEIWLFFGIRYETDILYESEWKKLAAQRPNFHYTQTISRPKNWTGEVGYVQEKIKKFITDPNGLDVYICGLPKMVEDVQATCLAMGFPKERITFEKYT
ncbi:MAG: FAD-dependent oxidoreductase [Candidatus Omnitrophica bacterium]|nr:FAD-dependent oxidoreductase [Candidatus Omnitrophota bacterium]